MNPINQHYDFNEFERSLIEAIHEASPDGILVVDSKDTIVSHNHRLFHVFNIAPEQFPNVSDAKLTGQPDKPLLTCVLEQVKNPECFLKRVKELYANPSLDDSCEIKLKDGRTLERHSKALWGKNHRYLGRVWFFRDITERKQTERALEEISYRDSLTGVANRRFFFERMTEELARARRFNRELSFILLDIDHFKRVNDKWGHAAGDRVLKNFCASALKMLRKEDLFGRIGGEEFAVISPDNNLQSAFLLAERLRLHTASQTIAEGPDIIRYTVSAGVATLIPSDISTEATLRRADKALYAAKHAGRNCVVKQSDN